DGLFHFRFDGAVRQKAAVVFVRWIGRRARLAGFPELRIGLDALGVGLIDRGVVTAVLNASVEHVLRIFVFREPQWAFLLIAGGRRLDHQRLALLDALDNG